MIKKASIVIEPQRSRHAKALGSLDALLLCCFIFFIFAASSFAGSSSGISGSAKDSTSEIQDLQMKGKEVISFQFDPNGQILVFQKGFSMTVGPTEFSSEKAVLWLVKPVGNSVEKVNYTMTGYLQGQVRLKRNSKVTSHESEMVVWFKVNGEVLVTSDKKEQSDPRGLELYASAYHTMRGADIGPISAAAEPLLSGKRLSKISVVQASELSEPDKEKKPDFRYPITLAPTSEEGIVTKVEGNIATIKGGFYLSQKQEIKGKIRLLELQADDAVIYLPEDNNEPNEAGGEFDEIMAAGYIKAIYLTGNVVMTEGQRTIRADEIFYDYENQKAIVINATIRNFDTNNGIPIYIRASKLQQLAANKFSAENAIITTSEFYIPQLSLNAASIIVTDNTAIERQEGEESKNDFDVRMRDVSLKYYNTKLPLYFPILRTNMVRPDLPIKSVHVGNDNTFGTYIETSWYTSRLLGLQEPNGTDSTMFLDYYNDRGLGGGIETKYYREDYFGRFLGYMIDDHGEDRLGRTSDRKNLEPDDELRGRFFWQNRYFLPYRWQLSTELSYLSDENFLESFYRQEYNLDKPQETLIHMKRIEDNWGLSLLGKARINDFENELEELPAVEFHWTGHSFLDDKLTFYSDTQVSRLRQRYSSGSAAAGSSDFFSFLTTRNEIDMPLSVNKFKIVPFVAGTAAFEDGLGFYKDIDDSIAAGEDNIFIGEAGVRGSVQPFWKVFPNVNSQLWDLNQLRHVIQPHFSAVGYTQSESVAEQRDIFNVGITQKLQTKRGSGSQKRTVDWMSLDTDITWVNNSSDDSTGADRYFWNNPYIPLINEESILIPQKDRRGSAVYGPRHNYFSTDFTWNLSDSTAFLSDMYYDLQDGVVQQVDYGFSHMRQPNLSYYVGSRYLKNIDNGYGEHGSNAFIYALTYILDPRYSLVYAGQVDFDYGAAVRNDIALIRRYHRLFWAVTYSRDESLDRQSVGISLWPQGVPDLAFGSSRYMDLGGSAGF
ncbi:MAG: LPS-assembly protein LptD [Sedimentisphaerales bacterium]|nr:LPS-assembly protein LptD [Sedimentisphaerales bacterium]